MIWEFEAKPALNPATNALVKGADGNVWPMSDPEFAGSPLTVAITGQPADVLVRSTAQGVIPQLAVDDAQLTGGETAEQVRWRSTDGAHVQVLTSFTRVFSDLDGRLSQAALEAAFAVIRVCRWDGASWVVPPVTAGTVLSLWTSPLEVADPPTTPGQTAVDLWAAHPDQP